MAYFVVAIILCLSCHTTFAQNNIKFATVGQQFGVADMDHFWLSKTPDETGIYFEQRSENPSNSSVGQEIQRSNALNQSVWGQFGVDSLPPWNARPGSIEYQGVPGSGKRYIRIRYSKNSPSSVPIEIFVNDEKQAEYIPANQNSWNSFTESNAAGQSWIEINLPSSPPKIDVVPASWDYGRVALGESKSKTFLVENKGDSDLLINSVGLEGPNSAEFGIENDSDSLALEPGGSYEVIVSFSPASPGVKNAILRFYSNDPEEDSLEIPLRGVEDNSRVVVEDFSDMVTMNDLGFNDFSGNMGTINKDGIPFSHAELQCSDSSKCSLQFSWDFAISGDPESFSGLFMSLFGLTETRTTFDGNIIETIRFPEHSLDLNRVDGDIDLPGGQRRFDEFCFEVDYQGLEPLTLRVELKDTSETNGIFTRFQITGSPDPQLLIWNFRDPNSFRSLGAGLDFGWTKVVTFIIERNNFFDDVHNPDSGEISFNNIWFTTDQGESKPESPDDMVTLLKRRAYQYFLDWSSRKENSFGIPQDRSTFADLLTIGGLGFAFPAHIVAVENNWINRSKAASLVNRILTVLNDSSAFGDDRMGKIGYKGWFYHFLGIDARRKINFDFPDTQIDESRNTVELSTIDTGLAILGMLAAQSFFDSQDQTEVEIRQKAQSIYDRVDWNFMLDPDLLQFYLGWKPNEDREGHPFEIPDSVGTGGYSGIPGQPGTLDYYTDEALIVILLGLGSTTHAIPLETYCALIRQNSDGLILTHPGALFTYQFLHAFVDTKTLKFPACESEDAVNWFENSRLAINRTIDYVEANSEIFSTYGPDSWGISSAEGPSDSYKPYFAPPVAVTSHDSINDGTVTYYSMVSAAGFGNDLFQRALQAVDNAWDQDQWHPRFGFPDAFNDDVSEALNPDDMRIIRSQGPWVNRALFAIDQGPMLLHLENSQTSLIWNLIANNANIKRALERLAVQNPSKPVLISPLQAEENVTTSPLLMWRSSMYAESYRAQVSYNSDFSTVVVDTSNLADTTLAVTGLLHGSIYYWRVRGKNLTGVSDWSDTFSFTTEPATRANDEHGEVPIEFNLIQNYPNPFNSETKIVFSIPRKEHVRILIFDVLGNQVMNIVDEEYLSGTYGMVLDGLELSSGVYLISMHAGSFKQTKKMILVR